MVRPCLGRTGDGVETTGRAALPGCRVTGLDRRVTLVLTLTLAQILTLCASHLERRQMRT